MYDSGKSAGTAVPWSVALELDTAGLLTTKAITASGTTTANAGVSTTTLTASGLITANEGITYSGVLTTTTNNGAKIGIQGQTDGTNARGIFVWDTADPNWGIYISQCGANKALNGGTAPAGGVDGGLTSYAIRFRVNNSSTSGFIWENSSSTALMSLKASDGQFMGIV